MISVLYIVVGVPLLLLLALHPVSELLAMVRRRLRRPSLSGNDAPRLLFVVPAHDEERLIRACVRSLLHMEYPQTAYSVVVVADNCSDRTAEVATAAGARSLVRHEPERPGKPQALGWALERLDLDEFAACVIIDADTVVDPGFAAVLARHEPLANRCVQAYFDVSNQEESWLTRLGAVLARVRYERSYPLKRDAGLNCALTGNGMCIGRNLLEDGWPAMSLTENWELYARFTAAGVPILYEQEARLYSQEASTLTQATTQRRRWLAGRTWVLRNCLRDLLGSDRIGAHQKLDAVAELAAPSPVLHGALAFALLLPAPFVLPGWLAAVFVVATLATLGPLAVHSVSVIRDHPDRLRIAASFFLLPAYAVWRIVVAFLTISTFRKGLWKKTERAKDPSTPGVPRSPG